MLRFSLLPAIYLDQSCLKIDFSPDSLGNSSFSNFQTVSLEADENDLKEKLHHKIFSYSDEDWFREALESDKFPHRVYAAIVSNPQLCHSSELAFLVNEIDTLKKEIFTLLEIQSFFLDAEKRNEASKESDNFFKNDRFTELLTLLNSPDYREFIINYKNRPRIPFWQAQLVSKYERMTRYPLTASINELEEVAKKIKNLLRIETKGLVQKKPPFTDLTKRRKSAKSPSELKKSPKVDGSKSYKKFQDISLNLALLQSIPSPIHELTSQMEEVSIGEASSPQEGNQWKWHGIKKETKSPSTKIEFFSERGGLLFF